MTKLDEFNEKYLAGVAMVIMSIVMLGLINNSGWSDFFTYSIIVAIVLAAIIYGICYPFMSKKSKREEQELQLQHDELDKKRKEKIAEEKRKYKEIELKHKQLLSTIEPVDIDVSYKGNHHFAVSKANKKLTINEHVYSFEDVLKFEVKDKEKTISISSTSPSFSKTTTDTGSLIGRTIAGGVIGGSVGAIIGGASASKTTETEYGETTTEYETEHDYTIIVNLNSFENPLEYISLGKYSVAKDKIAALLNVIINNK